MTQSPDDFDLASFLPYRMAVMAERLSTGMARRYRDEFGISIADWRILVHIADAGAVSIRDIHQKVHLEKPKASRAASGLEAAGYITKKTNPDDKRLVVLSLTPKGRALMDQLREIALAYQARLDRITAPHTDTLGAVLDALMAEDL